MERGAMKTLLVGQEVCINGGFGPVEGTVTKIVPPCIYVESNGQQRFNSDGKECGPNGEAYTYAFNVMFGPGPWEISRHTFRLGVHTSKFPSKGGAMKTLVVGQDVDLAYCQRNDRRGKVVKASPSGVEVQVADLLRFDNDGKETDASRRDRLGFGPSPGDMFYNSLWYAAPECGPWHLDNIPFTERTALLEQWASNYEATKK
jgi:hypothetical protein